MSPVNLKEKERIRSNDQSNLTIDFDFTCAIERGLDHSEWHLSHTTFLLIPISYFELFCACIFEPHRGIVSCLENIVYIRMVEFAQTYIITYNDTHDNCNTVGGS